MKLGEVRKATPADGPVFGGGSGIVILGGFKTSKEEARKRLEKLSNKDPVVEQEIEQKEESLNHQPEQEEE